MKIVKGVLTYTLILIGVLLIAGVLLFAGMAFLKFPVFGYRVTMATNQPKEVKTVKFNDVYLNESGERIEGSYITRTIVINSNNYDVKVRPFNDSVDTSLNAKARITYVDEAFGLVSNGHLIDKTNSVIEILYYDGDPLITNTAKQETAPKIVINLKTPQGILNYRNSRVLVELPVNSDASKYNYNLEVNSGKGDFSIVPYIDEIGNFNDVLTVNGMDITTTTGSATFYGLRESGDYGKVDSYVEFDYLNLKTEKGKFDFTKQKIKVVDNVKIDSSMGDFAFQKIVAGFTIEGENLVFDAEEINTGDKSFLYNCPHGTLRITKLNVGNQVGEIVTEYARVELDESIGDLSIQATYGNVMIKKSTSGIIDVTTTHGDITIGDSEEKTAASGTVAARSTYGDIKARYASNGWFTNKKGQINVEYTGDSSTHETRIETVDGAVYVKNLTGIVNATATGGANLNINFKKINQGDGKSNITIGSGKLTLSIPQIVSGKSGGFNLTGEMKGGASVDVYNASTKDVTYKAIDFKDGETSKTITDYAAANSYIFNLVSNGGKITIKM